jgi:3-oxoadipate enol-lactonase
MTTTERPRTGTIELDGAPLAYDLVGEGPPLVLVHAGVADRRMWDPQVAPLSERFTVVRYDLRGFGRSPDAPGRYAHHEQLLALLDHVGFDRVTGVGCSMGSFVLLSAAVVAPGRFRQLVVLSPVIDGVEPTGSVRQAWREEAEALDAGDVDRAVEVNLATWIDGPHRGPDDVDPEVRAWVGRMQADVFAHGLAGEEEELEPGPGEQLDRLSMPVCVVTGTLDQRWVLDCADRLAAGLPDVQLHAVDGVAHLPNVEAPERVTTLLLDLLPA